MNKTVQILLGVIGLLILFFVGNYFFLIDLSLRYTSTAILFLLAVIYLIINFSSRVRNLLNKSNYDVAQRADGTKQYIMPDEVKADLKIVTRVAAGVAGFFFVFYIILSSPILNASKYSGIIDVQSCDSEEDSCNYQDDIEELTIDNLDELPIVDKAYAEKQGQKALSEGGSSYGSQFHIGTYTDVIYQGKQYLVAPLEYSGFWKYQDNKATGTPGYVMVSKTDISDYKLVTKDQDENVLGLKYLESAYFGKDLDRRNYYDGNRFHKKSKSFFEIDEKGRPYWITPVLKPSIMINGGMDVYEVIVLDAQNGDVTVLTPEEIENSTESEWGWIDNVYPQDLVISQLNSWGKYQDGFLNSFLGKKGVMMSTYGSRRFTLDDDLVHFTGLTSAGADDATTGFVLIDTTTKSAKYYKQDGATEYAAMRSAEGAFQAEGYSAVFPVPVKVNGEHTYFITLKDNSGNVKGYSFVNVKDVTTVGSGSTLSGAYNDYTSKLGTGGGSSSIDNEILNGTVVRIHQDQSTGLYYLVLKDDNNIYIANPSNLSGNEIHITNVGDDVSFEATTGKNIVRFNNDTFDPAGEIVEDTSAALAYDFNNFYDNRKWLA